MLLIGTVRTIRTVSTRTIRTIRTSRTVRTVRTSRTVKTSRTVRLVSWSPGLPNGIQCKKALCHCDRGLFSNLTLITFLLIRGYSGLPQEIKSSCPVIWDSNIKNGFSKL